MSFLQTIDDYRVTFREEEDYLNCRLQYLQYCKDAVMPEVTFIQYIQNEMYYEKCVVEDIISVIDFFAPLESSYVVGNDNNITTTTAEAAMGSFAQGQDVYISGNLVVTGEVLSSNIIAGTALSIAGSALSSGYVPNNAEAYLSGYNSYVAASSGSAFGEGYQTAYQAAYMAGGTPPSQVDLSEPIPGVSKEYLSTEPLDEPIENRWEILDL